ncbi:MAG: tetratricopeptide repeat protein [Pelatocladus maniniholoensis HA4357-MV3]|jgi:serine/threonine protein kinase/lipoprotein NlpI|uniref:Tetratricopeptide repeat protein n=1 Tax=Pelatocladus maniniholoensis HA4357-MV3 TaxID=1117104 RepID=A0A9E3H7D8_9NOST|nr:tetratricopeptide repeat protein [Pelatocladus maniniholoensis HA4357-MV3]
MTEGNNNLLCGRYQIIQELGRGGFGVTYLATDTYSNILCAIKKLDPLNADLETAKRFFHREVNILNTLQTNQQVPKFFDYLEEDNSYYIVEEYIEGTSLAELVHQKWPEYTVVNFLQQILSVLAYLHAKNIIHRDVKPSNLIIRKGDNRFVLIDFGSVKKLDSQYPSSQSSITQTMIGTPGYAPSEQMAGRPRFNSDIYALGLTAIQLLTGMHPRELRWNEKDNIILPSDINIDPSLNAILVKMVYNNPDHRYQSVNTVIEDLNKTKISSPPTQPPTYYTSDHRIILTNLRFIKIWQIPIVLILLVGIIAFIEFFHPFIRPIYYLYEANKLLDERQGEAALDKFTSLKQLQPNSPEVWKGRGDALFLLGRDFAALQSYNRAIFLEPKDQKLLVKILINKGKVLYKQQNYQEALDIYEKVLKIDNNNPEGLSGKSLSLLATGKRQEALQYLNQLKQIRPDDPRIWQEIGFAIEQSQGKQAAKEYFQEALLSYDDLLRFKSKNPIYWTDRGSILLKLNRPQDALDSYEKALNIDNNFYEALIGKGNALNVLGKASEALFAFKQASQVRPQDYLVWFNQGILLTQTLRNHEEAIKAFEQAIVLKGDFHPAWIGKALALLELKRYQEALLAIDKARDLQPKDPDIWDIRGEILKGLGKQQEANSSFYQAEKLRGEMP